MADSAAVPSNLKPTDSAQSPYSLTPLSEPYKPGVASPTYGTSSYKTALANSGMTLNTQAQQDEMASANAWAQPKAPQVFTGLPQAPKTTAPASSAATSAPSPTKPTSAAAAAPAAPAPAQPSPLKTTPVQEGQYPEGWVVNKQLGYALPPGPPGSAAWPTREETGYTDASGRLVPGTDLRYTGYYTDGSNQYRYEDIDPITAQYYRWVAPWKNPYEASQPQPYSYGQPGQPG